MSDDIRIYGGGRQSGNPGQRRFEALARFKRGHKTGELVQGIFLRLEPVPPGTAWVSLDGAALLAALPEDLAELARRIAAGQGAGAMPTGVTEADFPIKRGQACYFLLEALEPEPILRMLSATEPKALARSAAEARWRGLVNLPLTQLAARYTGQRSLLERALRQSLWTEADLRLPFPSELPPGLADFADAGEAIEPESLQARYTDFLKSGEVKNIFSELETYRAALVENLRPYGLLDFFFTPWLCPAASGLELAFTRPGGEEAPAAMQDVSYKLQGLLENTRRELSGVLGGAGAQHVPKPDEPDLLRQILGLKPSETRSSFRRKA